LQILETLGFEDLFNQIAQTVIAGKPQPGDPPPGDIAETKRTASSNDARERRAAGIGRAKNAANAGAGNKRDRDAILLENLQNAKMRESTSESAA
jgi:hypothetical protein